MCVNVWPRWPVGRLACWAGGVGRRYKGSRAAQTALHNLLSFRQATALATKLYYVRNPLLSYILIL